MRTAEDIVATYHARRIDAEPVLTRMRLIRDTYNGELVVNVGPAAEKPAVANLVLVGIEQMAGRIASITPNIWFPPLRPGVAASERKADDRRQAVTAWWEQNRMRSKMRLRARYLVAYGTTPVVIRPHLAKHLPLWDTRNPLSAFPAADQVEPLVPEDLICAFTKPAGWLRRVYPDVAARVLDSDTRDDAQCIVLDYTDSDQFSLVYAGTLPTTDSIAARSAVFDTDYLDVAVDLVPPVPNRAQRPVAACPQRITLDLLQGLYDQVVGLYETQAKLTALDVTSVERGIFPDTYLVSRPGEQAHFVHGPYDGRTGEVNIVSGGDVRELANNPGFSTGPMIDRLERAQRMTGSIPADFTGESQTNVRTGRRGDAILSATVDYPILEAQETLAESLEVEDQIAIAVAQAYWGGTKTSFYLTAKGKPTAVTFTPNAIFDEGTHHSVSYPVSGTDMNALVVGVGQRIGLGTISKRTAAELDPLITDPEYERDAVVAEQLEAAVLAGISQQAAAGSLPPVVISRTAELVRSGSVELADAFTQAVTEYQQAQAQAQQPPIEPTSIGAPPMAPGPAGAATTPETVPESGQSLQNLAGLLTALRKSNTRAAGRAALGGSV